MSNTSVEQKRQLDELHKKIWSLCCDFWNKMSPDDYKDYVLGLLFYRYLSEKTETRVKSLLAEDGISYFEAWESPEYQEALKEELLDTLGFCIEPKYLFSRMHYLIAVEKKGFDIEYIMKAINALMDSTRGRSSFEAFDGIFDDMDLSSTKLGKTVADRSTLISTAIVKVASIDFNIDDAKIDVMGDAYEYLIGQFAASAGKKSGSFYTPAQVDHLLCQIASYNRPDALNVFDACGGSGALLLTLKNYTNVRNYYYQELTTTTYNLARMNFLIHNIGYDAFHMANDDTLTRPSFLDIPMDICVSNPPYSANWSADKQFEDDERFSKYGVLAPKSKADYAFLLSMFHTLKDDGCMCIVMPHGVLFRGGTERTIRKALIDRNAIDTVIGLPSNVFFGTSIPVCVLVLRKDKKNNDIFIIDASHQYEPGKNQNFLRDKDVETILNAYVERKNIDKLTHIASFDEVVKNDYNLNIPRYVDGFEEEEQIDINEQTNKLKELNKKSTVINNKLADYFKQLGLEV